MIRRWISRSKFAPSFHSFRLPEPAPRVSIEGNCDLSFSLPESVPSSGCYLWETNNQFDAIGLSLTAHHFCICQNLNLYFRYCRFPGFAEMNLPDDLYQLGVDEMVETTSEKNQSTIADYVGDMNAVESHIKEALDRQLDMFPDQPKAAAAVRKVP